MKSVTKAAAKAVLLRRTPDGAIAKEAVLLGRSGAAPHVTGEDCCDHVGDLPHVTGVDCRVPGVERLEAGVVNPESGRSVRTEAGPGTMPEGSSHCSRADGASSDVSGHTR